MDRYDVAAGTLYEYRVGAVISCGTGNTAQEFFNPTPYPIGFRSNYGGVKGRITFENGAPEDSVYVVVEPQGLNLARNSLILESGEYAKLDIDLYERRSDDGEMEHWPDIHSPLFNAESYTDINGNRVSEGISISQWIKVPKTTIVGDSLGNGGASEAPLLSMNYIDPFGDVEKEAVSIWAREISGSDSTYRISVRQSGQFTDLSGLELDLDKYQHVTITLANVETGRAVPGMRIYVRAHSDDPAIVEQPVGFYDMRGPDDIIEMIRDNWSGWLWNAANGTAGYCSDPNGLNFNGDVLGGSFRHCDYELPSGCTDPQGQNYLEYALYEPGGGENACIYTYYGTGEDISVHWFSDDDTAPYEYPVITRVESDLSETVVKSFRSALLRYQDSLQVLGQFYPFSMAVMNVKLPNGDYRLRVLDSRHEGTGGLPHGEATTFAGNFSVYNSVGFNHVTCSQYHIDEADDGAYDLSIVTHSALASGVGHIDDFLLVDCAECFSVNFRNNDNIELILAETGKAQLQKGSTYDFWWRTADVMDGDTYRFGDVFKIVGDDASGDITLSIVEDTEDPSNMGNAKFALVGPAGTMRRIPEQPTFNEYAIIPGQWYHVVLAIGQNEFGDQNAHFTMRSTDQNLLDNEPWNNPRHFEFDNLDDVGNAIDPSEQFVVAPIDYTADFNAESLVLGGSDVLIHRVSIWKGILSEEEGHALFDGDALRHQTFNATNMPNELGLWTAPDAGDLPMSRLVSSLVPDNAGRFVDQMLDKQLYIGGTNIDPNPITDAVFEGSLASEDAGGLTLDGTTGANELPSINRKSIRRAPYGQCNPGCSRVFDACNFNPFANQFVDCELSCTGSGLTSQKMASERVTYDEIRAWDIVDYDAYGEGSRIIPGGDQYGINYQSWEAAQFWMQKYPSNDVDGILLMYDADEGLGNVIYDRAKYGSDVESWIGHNATLYKQTFGLQGTDTLWYQTPNPAVNYFAEGALRDLPQSLGNWEYSNVNVEGLYAIRNVKYVGSGDFFDIKPSKSTSGFEHIFSPAQRTTLIGDILLISEDQDFIDKSAFEVEVDVNYLDMFDGEYDYSGTGEFTASDCPVEGVQFEVDGSIMNDATNEPVETDAEGRATLTLTRGYHQIKPILTHLVDGSTDDDHVFDVPDDGKTVFVEGPIGREVDGKAKAEYRFVDKTVRRAIGRVLGGSKMVATAWDESENNLGVASFNLTPINKLDPDLEMYYQNELCPAVKVTTDTLTGQYDISLLPMHYRISIGTDSAGTKAERFDHVGGFDDFRIDGWQLDTAESSALGHTWVAAFSNDIMAYSTGEYNPDKADYTIWDMTDRSIWNQTEQYPLYPEVSNEEAYPADNPASTNDDVYERKDLIFNAPVQLSVKQLYRNDNNECEPESDPIVDPDLGDLFLGEVSLHGADANNYYVCPLDAFLSAYGQAAKDPTDPNETLIAPFPAGLPIVRTANKYCTELRAGQRYHVDMSPFGGTYLYQDTATVKGESYDIVINNTLAISPDNQATITLNDDSVHYEFTVKEPTEDYGGDLVVAPTGNLNIALTFGGYVIDTWNPFAHVISDTTNVENIPQAYVDPGSGEVVFRHDRFDAIILGEYAASQPVPVSTDPILDFILRDPPGGGSSCAIAQGSSMSFERSIETASATELGKERGMNASFAAESTGGLITAPLGIGINVEAETEASAGATLEQTETYSKTETGAIAVSEEISFSQEIATSAEPLDYGGGMNQDLFFGQVRNTAISTHRIFDAQPVGTALNEASSNQLILDLDQNAGGVVGTQLVIQDWDGNGEIDQIPMFKLTNQGGTATGDVIPFVLNWRGAIKTAVLPASNFMKTELTIATVDIPLLEFARDAYFQNHPELYNWPEGTPSSSAVTWDYPDGMKLANNDDHRWELFHQDWLDSMNTVYANYPTQASTITRGYDVGSAMVVDDYIDYNEFAATATEQRIIEDAISGNDKIGPGYQFLGSDVGDDSVRYYNNQIAAWSRMLAENEFEKINARRYIFDNLSQFDDVSELSNWAEDLESSGMVANNYSLDDFSYTSDELGAIDVSMNGNNSIWEEADFEPYFLNFSGGGAEFTQTIEKTNAKEQSRSIELSSSKGGALGAEADFNEATGISTSFSDTGTQTETRSQTQGQETSVSYTYTLSDPDERDFFLVAVIPGRGLNGPIFLNLGAATSCSYQGEDAADYAEWYPALIPSKYHVTPDRITCDANTMTEPVWQRSIDPAGLSLNSSTGQVWHGMDQANGWANQGTLGGEAVAAGFIAPMAAAVAGSGALAAAQGNFGGIGIAVGAGIAIGALYGGDLAATAIWRAAIEQSHGTSFAEAGYDASSLLSIENATQEKDIFIAPGMCSDIFDPDKKFVVQPASVPLEVPELTVSYSEPGGQTISEAETVEATAFMDESIGITLHLRNVAPNPFASSSMFHLFNDGTANTLGALVNLGGSGSATSAMEIYPNWSEQAPLGGAYDVPVIINHSGVDDPEFQSGSVTFVMQSLCDDYRLDAVKVDLNFEPACSDVELTQPLENWSANLDRVVNGGVETSTMLDVEVDVAKNHFTNWVLNPEAGIEGHHDYTTGLGPVVVEYRLGNGSNWSAISNSAAFGTDSTAIANEDGTVSDVSLDWAPLLAEPLCNPFMDAAGSACLGYEGQVLLRARSLCQDPFALPKVSEVVTGYVDYTRPELFGNVLPSDGFYEPGDELRLRWSEGMETSNPSFTLNPDSILLRATQNTDYTHNSGGVKFTGNEHIAILQGPHLDAYYADEDMIGFPGWSVSWKQWGGGVYGTEDTSTGILGDETSTNPDDLTLEANEVSVVIPPSEASGVVFTQGDQSEYSLTAEFVDLYHFRLMATSASGNISSYTIDIAGAGAEWNGLWNQLELEFEPTATTGTYNWRLSLNGAMAAQNGVISGIQLEPTRITLGNGWYDGHATNTPLSMPMQDFRLWNSQRETYASETPAFILTGKEIGLQAWLPMDELHGTPQDRARMRAIQMEANWYSPEASHALDFSGNANGALIPTISGLNWTPDGTRNTTFELWVKPGNSGSRESFVSINGTANPDIDLRRVGWNGFIEADGTLGFANGTDTLRTQSPLSDAWHHVALVRRYNGTALLYVDGEEVASDPSYDHGKLIPVVLTLGARNEVLSGIQPCHDISGVSFNTDGNPSVNAYDGNADGLLGWAVFNGSPTAIYGDGYIGTDGLDYSSAFYSTAQECIDACPCIDLSSVSFDTSTDDNVSIGWAVLDGTITEIFGDGQLSTDGLDYSSVLQATEQDGIDACDAENSTVPANHNEFFTGKLDEIRVWNTALTQETIKKQMRDGVYGYENLVFHAPFEIAVDSDSETVLVNQDETYVYAPYDGFDYFNDDESLVTTNGYEAKALENISSGGEPALTAGIQNEDAPLMHSEPQTSLGSIGDVVDVTWNSLHDECIIELSEQSLYKYEDQLVSFVIPQNQLRDEAGNAVASDLVFEMLIDRNPLKWLQNEGQEEVEFGTIDTSFTYHITNVGNVDKYFEIDGLPAWVEASPQSGMIPASSTMAITFVPDLQALPIGYAEFDARLKGGLPCGSASSGGFCHAERFTLGMDIYATPPDLEVNYNDFELLMPLVTKAYINNTASRDEDDIVMAFVDDELRGFANLDLDVAGQNLGFVSVAYNEQDTGKTVEFQLWDASYGMVRAQVGTRWPTLEDAIEVKPNPNGIGNLFEPLLLRSTSKISTSTELYPGWNWVSVNVVDTPATFSVMEAFHDVPSEDILQVKNHLKSFKQPDENGTDGWSQYASEESDVHTRYMVQMKSDDQAASWTMSNTGFALNPTDESSKAPLVYGWNELGYLPHQSFSVKRALRSLADADSVLSFNDLIQSRGNGFAMYAGDGEWIGSLNTMRPGQGYRLRLGLSTDANAGSAAGELEWPISLGMEYLLRAEEEAPNWEMDIANLESNMMAVIRLELGHEHPQSLYDALGAFIPGPDGPICIGQARPMDTDQGLLYFLSVFGDASSKWFENQVSFRWLNGTTAQEWTAEETLLFEASALHGQLDAPMLLHFRNLTEGETANQLIAFPNPFRDELSIHWHGEETILELRLEDATGKLIDIIDCDGLSNGPCRIGTSHLSAGVYFIHAVTATKNHAARVIK